MKEFGSLLGYSIEMEQKKSENPKGPRKPAALWMQILPAVSAYVRSIILNYHDSEGCYSKYCGDFCGEI